MIYLFIDDYEYNNYFDEESKAVKEELDNLPPLEVDEDKYYSVPYTPLSKGDKNRRGRIKNLNSKQTVNQAPDINSTNKSWK